MGVGRGWEQGRMATDCVGCEGCERGCGRGVVRACSGARARALELFRCFLARARRACALMARTRGRSLAPHVAFALSRRSRLFSRPPSDRMRAARRVFQVRKSIVGPTDSVRFRARLRPGPRRAAVPPSRRSGARVLARGGALGREQDVARTRAARTRRTRRAGGRRERRRMAQRTCTLTVRLKIWQEPQATSAGIPFLALLSASSSSSSPSYAGGPIQVRRIGRSTRALTMQTTIIMVN